MHLLKRCLLPALGLLLTLPLAAQEPKDVNRNVRFGLPTPAKPDPKQREDYLLERPQYSLSYNAKTRTPNWVSWALKKEDIGRSVRPSFLPDPLLPTGFAKVTSNVYDGSGFDRGHMCPAQDRSSTQENMDATFVMTNVIPQSPNCNQRAWERLESYCRDLTRDGHVLYICSGPAGTGGEGKEGKEDEIGRGRLTVNVPAKVWKVIMVLPDEDAMPTKETRVIAVIMPNDQSVDFDWAKYRTSVHEVEKLTDFKFWPTLPKATAKALKAKTDEVNVKVPMPRKD
jgi:endonuclease G, mitochondrial